MALIDFDDFLEIYPEAKQQPLYLCEKVLYQEADPRHGYEAQYTLTKTKVRGFVAPTKEVKIAIDAGLISSGDQLAKITAYDLDENKITPNTRVEYRGKLYKINLVQYYDVPGYYDVQMISPESDKTVVEPIAEPQPDPEAEEQSALDW